MDPWKLGKALLFPHIAAMILLVFVSTVLLVVSMAFVGSDTPIAYVSYALSAYTLSVFCVKIPKLVRFFRAFKSENKYMRRWREDARLRVNVSLYGSLLLNGTYAAFQLWLGFYHHTFWFGSLGAYYLCLAFMRFLLLLHTKRYMLGERLRHELVIYRACGWVFLVMNLSLALIVFFMTYWGRTFEHHMITAIAMAAYTFAALAAAIVNVVKYRRYESPVLSAAKAISLAAALVSVLTLESTMLTTFGDEAMTATIQKRMLAITGTVICLLIVLTAIRMIAVGTARLKQLQSEVKNEKQ